MRMILAALAALTLAACSHLDETMESWVGSREGALVAAWGPPDSVYASPDGKVRHLTWRDERIWTTPATATTWENRYDPNLSRTTVSGGDVVRVNCVKTFVVVGGVVRNWSYRGC